MARPRRGEGPDAIERMRDAFWAMLAEMSYTDIKVVQLAKRAGMSPNTLYYHFDGIGALARHALSAELDPQLAKELIAGGDIGLSEDRMRRFARVALAARSGSSELTSMLAATLRALWLAEAGLREGDLDDAARQDLAFVFGGVVSMLADETLGADPCSMAAFRERPLGQGVAQTMARLMRLAEEPR